MTAIDFPDWQSSAAPAGADYQIQSAGLSIPGSGNVTTPVVQVTGFQALLISLSTLSANPWQYIIKWFQDPAGSLLVYQEPTYSRTVPGVTYVVPTVKSPYLAIEGIASTAAAVTATAAVFGVAAGVNAGDVLPPQVLADTTATSIGASSTVNFTPASLNPGPAIFSLTAAALMVGGLQRWNGTAWVNMAVISATTNAPGLTAVNVPSDDVRIFVTNTTAGAANATFSLTHGG